MPSLEFYRGRILVVDDDPMVLGLLTETLEHENHKVTPVADAEQALVEVERQEFDLVLSDLHLPGLSGVELMVRIKERQPMLPVVVVTGAPALDKAIDAMKKGAADFITKPFSIEHIHHIVQKNLQERRLIIENQRLMAELNNKAVIEKLNRELHQKINHITKIYKISESLQTARENKELWQYIVDLAAELTEAQRVSLLTIDPSHRFLGIRAALGVSGKVQRETSLRIGQGVAGLVAQTSRPHRAASEEGRNSPLRDVPGARSYQSDSWLSAPSSSAASSSAY